MHSPKYRPRVLTSAASEHGSTTEIARLIGDTLIDNHMAVDIVPPAAVDSVEYYDAVILGSAVYAGHWLAAARDFAIRFRDPLGACRVWLFSSGPVGDPTRKLVRAYVGGRQAAGARWSRGDGAGGQGDGDADRGG
jgi:menaquinone-dependent protoporphyrinogen oxidase